MEHYYFTENSKNEPPRVCVGQRLINMDKGNGKGRYWFIQVNGNTFQTIYGQIGGKETISEPVIKKDLKTKTGIESAWTEVCSTYVKKIREGYSNETENVVEKMEKLDVNEENEESSPMGKDIVFPPMLANSITEKNIDKILFPIMCQPKYDGNRTLFTIENNEVLFFSRNLKQQGNNISQVFSKEAHLLISTFMKIHKVKKVIFDGELYKHGINLQKIGSIVRGSKNIEELKSLNIMIFTCVVCDKPELSAVERNNMILEVFTYLKKDILNPKIIHVPNEICNDFTEVQEYFDFQTKSGYEGLVLYRMDAVYEHKRSDNILKFKSYLDAEGVVVGFKEGVGKFKGRAIPLMECNELVNSDGKKIILKEPIRFSANPKMNDKQKSFMWNNQSKFIGQIGTFKYFSLSDKNIPLQPNFMRFIEPEIEGLLM